MVHFCYSTEFGREEYEEGGWELGGLGVYHKNKQWLNLFIFIFIFLIPTAHYFYPQCWPAKCQHQWQDLKIPTIEILMTSAWEEQTKWHRKPQPTALTKTLRSNHPTLPMTWPQDRMPMIMIPSHCREEWWPMMMTTFKRRVGNPTMRRVKPPEHREEWCQPAEGLETPQRRYSNHCTTEKPDAKDEDDHSQQRG